MSVYTNAHIAEMLDRGVFKDGDLLFVVPCSEELAQQCLSNPYRYYEDGDILSLKHPSEYGYYLFTLEKGVKYTLNSVHEWLYPYVNKEYKDFPIVMDGVGVIKYCYELSNFNRGR